MNMKCQQDPVNPSTPKEPRKKRTRMNKCGYCGSLGRNAKVCHQIEGGIKKGNPEKKKLSF